MVHQILCFTYRISGNRKPTCTYFFKEKTIISKLSELALTAEKRIGILEWGKHILEMVKS